MKLYAIMVLENIFLNILIKTADVSSSTVRCNSNGHIGQSAIRIKKGRPPKLSRHKGGLLLFEVGKQSKDKHTKHQHQY